MSKSVDGKKSIVNCVRIQKLGEEIANAISHGVGALLAIAGTVLLIVKAALYGHALNVVCVSLYGASLIILYTNSTLYHALAAPRGKRVFQIFDHCSIFLLILGTYIPISLVTIGGALGWTLFGINTFCAVCGIVFTSISLKKFHKISMILYIVMGWLVIVAIKPVVAVIPPRGLILLVVGGVSYTAGIIFYKNKNLPYAHFIWHLFVFLGSILHYFMIYIYCCNG
jgi:hemolysin III